MTKLKTNDFSLAFFENGKELESAPGEEHHQIVIFFGDSNVPVIVCELPLEAQCDDMEPDGEGGSRVSESFHITPEAMIKTGRCMAAAFDLLDALEAVVAISDRKHDAWDKAHAAIALARGKS